MGERRLGFWFYKKGIVPFYHLTFYHLTFYKYIMTSYDECFIFSYLRLLIYIK